MNNTRKFALLGVLAFALSGQVMAQAGGGGTAGGGSAGGAGGGASNGPSGTDAMGASGSMGMHKKSHGTTLHEQDKASHLKGAKAANAASALGTNDKGAPQ
jgi:hypothetical protein